MTAVIRHRGPDDDGVVQRPGMSLGARRLSIIDVEGGHQPLSNERGQIWAAQNGEIYNHAELRDELRRDGHAFRSRCDTEVLPHLYERYGPALCERLHGKFAVAVWDAHEQHGILVRDRLGVKPLYYAVIDDVVVFGSELKCVIASGLVSDALDPEALAAYLMLGYVPGPMTPLKDVRKLMPGECLTVGGGKIRSERYWRYPTPDPDFTLSLDEWAERLTSELGDAVRARMMSDVPVGALLSGGLDSSLVAALMTRHADRPVKTFSVGLAGVGKANELADARRVASHLGTEHRELELPLTASTDVIERLAWHMDEPVRDLSAYGLLALSELAAQEITVALSGQGADELFGGYRKHRVASLAATWHRVPTAVRGSLAALGRRGPGEIRRLAVALQSPDPVSRLLASSGLLRPDLREGLFAGALAEQADAARHAAARHLDGAASATPLAALLHLDGQLALVDDLLHYFDRASMAHSLEVRVPFLDHNIVETCARMPDSVKVRQHRTKHVLRTAAKGIVPEFVLSKRKRGFLESTGSWLAADGASVVERTLLAPDARYAEILDRPIVEQHIREWRAGARDRSEFLLAIVTLEIWLSSYLPRSFAAARGDAIALAG